MNIICWRIGARRAIILMTAILIAGVALAGCSQSRQAAGGDNRYVVERDTYGEPILIGAN